MKSALLALAIAVSLVSPAPAEDVIGLSLPLKGRFAKVADRMEFGALLAGDMLKKAGREVKVVSFDDGCDPKTAAATAAEMIKANTKIVVGSVCFKLATALAQELKTVAGDNNPVPVISWNDRNMALARLRDVDQLALYSLSSDPNAEARAVVDLVFPKFDGKPFAIIDDGSVYGRALADAVRLLGEEAGFKPIANTNFRPLQSNQISVIKRLQKSGVEALFIAAAAEDVATIINDLKSLGLNWSAATGEQGELLRFSASNPAALEGLMMVREADYSIKQEREGLTRDQTETSVLAGYALVEVADAWLKSANRELVGTTVDTVIGPLTFNEFGRAAPAPFVMQRWQNGGFTEVSGN